MNHPNPYDELRTCARQIRWSKRLFALLGAIDLGLVAWTLGLA